MDVLGKKLIKTFRKIEIKCPLKLRDNILYTIIYNKKYIIFTLDIRLKILNDKVLCDIYKFLYAYYMLTIPTLVLNIRYFTTVVIVVVDFDVFLIVYLYKTSYMVFPNTCFVLELFCYSYAKNF